MSTEAKNIRTLGIDLAFSISASISDVAAKAGKIFRGTAQENSEPAQATAANTFAASRGHEYQSIMSLKGMFANDPAWDDLPAFLENYWREIDATVETD